MKIHAWFGGACAALAAAFLAGCDLGEQGLRDDDDPTNTTTVVTTTTSNATPVAETPPPARAGDELDISGATLLGPHKGVPVRSAPITRDLYSSNKEGKAVRLSFETLGWPSDGGVDGRVFIFWEESGGVVGGHFDWHGNGQTVKTLENVYGGYLDGRQPPAGATVWFCLSDLDGRERTNVTRSDTTW